LGPRELGGGEPGEIAQKQRFRLANVHLWSLEAASRRKSQHGGSRRNAGPRPAGRNLKSKGGGQRRAGGDFRGRRRPRRHPERQEPGHLTSLLVTFTSKNRVSLLVSFTSKALLVTFTSKNRAKTTLFTSKILANLTSMIFRPKMQQNLRFTSKFLLVRFSRLPRGLY